MKDENKSKGRLINELSELRGRIAELEASEADYRRTEDELLLHREVVKNMAEGICLVRASDAMIVYANPKFEKMFGYGPGELNGKPVTVVNYEEQSKRAQQVADEIIVRLTRYGEATYEVQNIKKDGTRFWCRANTSTFDHPEYGKVWIAVHTDINESKLAEENLRNSERILSMAQQVSHTGSWEWNLQDNELIWSDETYRQFGLKPKEITPTYAIFESFVHPDDRELVNQSVEQALKGNKPYLFDARMISTDGTEWIMQAQGMVYRNKDGEAVRLMGTQRDITARKQLEEKLKKYSDHLEKLVEERTAELKKINEKLQIEVIERKHVEEELRESEEKYRSLFENMRNGFAYCEMIFDENNNKPIDFIYLEINAAFERLTGLKREDVIGKKVTEVIPTIKDKNPELFDIYGEVALTGKGTQFDIYFEPLNIWLSISVYSPRKGYFAAVFENITERKQAEEEREKLISDLQAASAKIKTLKGIIPICAKCKKIRDDKGYWNQVEVYIRDHTEAEFSHGLCPECAAEIEKEIDEMG